MKRPQSRVLDLVLAADLAGDELRVVDQLDLARPKAPGELEVTQRGEVVDLDSARGPIRLRRSQDG